MIFKDKNYKAWIHSLLSMLIGYFRSLGDFLKNYNIYNWIKLFDAF